MSDTDENLSVPDDWNADMVDELADEGTFPDFSSLVVYSRDWTIATIFDQISNGNINLNPKFQRRNAWKDDKRSRLIESLIVGIPVPEIVFAEHPEKKKSYLVVDGKQRLLTIAGFIDPKKVPYWKNPKLRKLNVRADLTGLTYTDLKDGLYHNDTLREFENADVRCTIISNYESNKVLYDIFYRLNTGSVPLSSQELRQALNPGEFADYLMHITSKKVPIHPVLLSDGPDPRLRDVEMILRYISFSIFSRNYSGTLRSFLDGSMRTITESWDDYKRQVDKLYADLNSSISKLLSIFKYREIGRKYSDNKWETRLNKVLFEVQVLYFSHVDMSDVSKRGEEFKQAFMEFCSEHDEFRRTIEAGTNSLENYAIRHRLFAEFMSTFWAKSIPALPFEYSPAQKV